MIDRAAQQALKPMLVAMARRLQHAGVSADALSLVGFGLGLLAAGLIALHQPLVALIPLLLSRLCDGLDGTLARLTKPTDRGAFLDIALDFLFYASVPLAFAAAYPATHALPAAALLAAFIGTGSSFLAFALMAERRGLVNPARPDKGLFYLGGLTEGGETLAVFVAMCVWPEHFPWLAGVFAALCVLTTLARLRAGWQAFTDKSAIHP